MDEFGGVACASERKASFHWPQARGLGCPGDPAVHWAGRFPVTVKVSDHVDILTAQDPGPAILRVTGSPCFTGIFPRPFRPLGVPVRLLQSPEFQGDDFFGPCR